MMAEITGTGILASAMRSAEIAHACPGECTGRVDEHYYGKPEPGGKLVEALHLAVALGVGHPEVALHAAVDVRSFVVANEDDVMIPDPGQSAPHGGVVAE
jgi:hypothetical protein